MTDKFQSPEINEKQTRYIKMEAKYVRGGHC